MLRRHPIGIDLGTTFSVLAVKSNGIEKIDIITNSDGERTTPSCVQFKSDGQILIGKNAKSNLARFPKEVIYDAKRVIGKHWKEIKDTFHNQKWSFDIGQCKELDTTGHYRQDIVFFIPEIGFLYPEDISSLVLAELKLQAENFLGYEVKEAVITVPAYFNDSQRNATKVAAELAGLSVMRIINEPTAAALAYGIGCIENTSKSNINTSDINNVDINTERIILVADIGGGTTDFSLLNVSDGIYEVIATSGDSQLGGQDFDNALMEYCLNEFKKNNRISTLKINHRKLGKLRQECEIVKKVLSNSQQANIYIDSFLVTDSKELDLNISLTRAKFNIICDTLFNRVINPINQLLMDAKISKYDVNDIVMVGGSSRIPRIQDLISQKFDGKELYKSINPDECVAYGAAVQATILANNRWQRELREKGEDIDEEYDFNDILLMDVAPLTLGIETEGGVMTPIIHRNTNIPTEAVHTFSTSSDNETDVTISIYEGERPLTKYNNKLASFELKGITRAKRGIPRIEVIFEIDVNGILSVKARELKRDTNVEFDNENINKIENNQEIRENNNETNQKYTELIINRMNYIPNSADELKKCLDDAKNNEENDNEINQKLNVFYKIQNLVNEINSIINDPAINLKFPDYYENVEDPNSIKTNPFIVSFKKWIEFINDWFKKHQDFEKLSLDFYEKHLEVIKDDKKKFDKYIYMSDESTIVTNTSCRITEDCNLDQQFRMGTEITNEELDELNQHFVQNTTLPGEEDFVYQSRQQMNEIFNSNIPNNRDNTSYSSENIDKMNKLFD